jgi:carbon monoxide dehydrogenase subunit G
MIFEGKYLVETSREKLWDFILDPNKMGRCLSDLKSLNVDGENRFTAIIAVGVGFIKADLKFKIEIVGEELFSRVRLNAVGTGSGSSINLVLAIELRGSPDGSELHYKADVKVGGMIAGLGQVIIKDTAEKTIKAIFDCVRSRSSEG